MPIITKAKVMIQSMESLLDERSQLSKKERKLVRTLNRC